MKTIVVIVRLVDDSKVFAFTDAFNDWVQHEEVRELLSRDAFELDYEFVGVPKP